MVSRLGLILFIFSCMLMACGGDESSVSEDSTAAESSSAPAPKENAPTSEGTSSGANTVAQMPWTFLTDGIFHNNATISSGQNPGNNPNKGAWIDFKDNGTYDYGKYGDKSYSGTWFYDDKKETLELNPGGEERPSEWTVKYKDATLIWIGTNKYGDNATQMRWLRRNGYPEPPAN